MVNKGGENRGTTAKAERLLTSLAANTSVLAKAPLSWRAPVSQRLSQLRVADSTARSPLIISQS